MSVGYAHWVLKFSSAAGSDEHGSEYGRKTAGPIDLRELSWVNAKGNY